MLNWFDQKCSSDVTDGRARACPEDVFCHSLLTKGIKWEVFE